SDLVNGLSHPGVFQDLLSLVYIWSSIGGQVHILNWLGSANHRIRDGRVQRCKGIAVDILSDGCAVNRCRYSLTYCACLFFICFFGFGTERLGIEVEDDVANLATGPVNN